MLYLVLCNILRTICQPQISASICICDFRRPKPSAPICICDHPRLGTSVSTTNADVLWLIQMLSVHRRKTAYSRVCGSDLDSEGVNMHWNHICDFRNRPIYPGFLLYLSVNHKYLHPSVSVTSADPNHLHPSVSVTIRGPEHPVPSVSAYVWTTEHLHHLYRAIYICVKL